MGCRAVIVLDTHAWIWFCGDDRLLSPAALDAVRRSKRIGISPISIWEVSMLCSKGRLVLSDDLDAWVARALAVPRVEVVPLAPSIAILAGTLPIHGDPADRIIVATALSVAATLVTKDEKIRESALVTTLWRAQYDSSTFRRGHHLTRQNHYEEALSRK